MQPAGILLCAGRGARFDPSGATNKLLAALPDGETVAGASALHMLGALPEVIAVVRAGDAALAEVLRDAGCTVIECADASLGMAASLKQALRCSLPAPFGWIIALGDMPFVDPSTIAALADALADGASIAVPTYAGRRGNPVAFATEHLEALLALEGDQGARKLLDGPGVVLVPVDDPGILRDVDLGSDLYVV
ncbi:MAG: nucleotidyltransferase family protein [Telluria sp.]